MLDFSKIVPQLQSLQADSSTTDDNTRNELAQQALADACNNLQRLDNKLNESSATTFWPLCKPLEEFGFTAQVAILKAEHAAISVDGSQIMPSHHEVHNCYLINIGKATIHYRDSQEDLIPVSLESEPYLFHSSEDLYPLIDRRRLHVDEQFVSSERTLLELQTLADAAGEAQVTTTALAAFVDGSLIQWHLSQMPDSYQSEYSLRLYKVLESFRSRRIPLVGYISNSRSSDIMNALRVWKCPFTISSCAAHCGRLHEEDYPCSSIWPLSDRQLMDSFLQPQERSAVFASAVRKGPALPEEHSICFAYLNVGREVARLEFPKWLFQDQSLFDQALRITLSQAHKGAGYPVALAEAHNLAVIRSSDRTQFFELVTRHLISSGVQRVRVSAKESGKRRGIV